MGRQIVFVLSTNFAGSHLLALQLGSHSACESIGEIHHVKRDTKRHRPLCVRCPGDEACPIFRGVRAAPREDLFDRVFDNIEARNPHVRTAIDNSKKPEWAREFLPLDPTRYTLKFIHLIRDPRALVRRWDLLYDKPAERLKVRFLMARRCWQRVLSIASGTQTNVYLWKWLHQNRQITDFIKANNLDARVVTYHDLVTNPDHVLGGIMPWLGLAYEPRQREYWAAAHHGTLKLQYLKSPADDRPHLDQRWREHLGESEKQAAITHKPIASYLQSLNLNLDSERGLIAG